jgi:putative hydrolase of the HAD superfamily
MHEVAGGPRPKPSVLVFDLWNTLASSVAPTNPIIELGRQLKDAGCTHWLRAIERGMMRRPLPGIETAIGFIEAEAGVTLSTSDRAEAIRIWHEASAEVELFADVLPALDRLRGRFRLAMLSNTQSFEMEFVEESGLAERFEVIHYSCDTGLLKPDPRAFAATLAALGAAPSDALMIGDNWKDDIAGARAAGLRARLIRRNGPALSHREVGEGARGETFVRTLAELEGSLGAAADSRDQPRPANRPGPA